ncbi:hypothetical protein KIN20_034966, partial [Parelaphostrongylus tenuis]
EICCRSQDTHTPAIAQVAPLRPESDSVSCAAQFSNPTQIQDAQLGGVRVVDGGVTRDVPATVNDVLPTRDQSSPPSAAAEIDTTHAVVADEIDSSASISLPEEANTDPLNERVSNTRVTTDDIQARNDSTLSPFDVRVTSTPIDDENSTTIRAESERNEGWEPRGETLEDDGTFSTANPSIGPSAAADHNGRKSTSLLSMRNAPERRSVQSRYRMFKEHFSGIMGRLDQYRTELPRMEFRSSSRSGNPLMANMSNSVSGWRSAVNGSRNSVPPHLRSYDVPHPHYHHLKGEEANEAVFSDGTASMNRSFEVKPPTIYGDDFVDEARRSRRSRLSRPNSRIKSEFGENGHHHEHHHYDTSRSYNMTAAETYPSGRRSAHTSMGTINPQEYYVQQAHIYKEQRRPRSSFDPRSMERYQRYGERYGDYDVYNEAQSSVSEDADSDEKGDSEEEMTKYTQKGRNGGSGEMFDVQQTVGEELYYFGAIHLDQFRVRSILHNFPPPMEYHQLPPIEKAAYLFYVAVYKKLYSDVGDFHRKFNREYYKYTCDGDSDNVALWKICKSMQDEYHFKRLEECQKAYEASQRQPFSDERDSADGMSERASMDDNHDDRTSDILSVDSTQRAPLKHRVPHAFVTFGPGGKLVTVHPDFSVSVVQIDDIKTIINDPHTVRLIDSAQSFRGPLLIGQTPTHSLTYDNVRNSDVTDCLLIWKLLDVIVQQQGRVTGPDLARLLVSTSSTSCASTLQDNQLHHERSASPPDRTLAVVGSAKNTVSMDADAYDKFTGLLLGGHITEAIDGALSDGLFADAIVLARRLLGHDLEKLAAIEERFITTRPQCSPVVTLLSVSSKKLVPILMNPTGDDSGSWRTHAAIILANLTSSEAMQTVYDLGKALAKRDYNCAADFCFLAVAVLTGINPFKPTSTSSDELETRQNIDLVHASIPEHDVESLQCRYGFSFADFHATEIFNYAIGLSNANGYSPLGECIEYQRKRIQYAHLIAEFGGFASDAFRYCMEVARSIWNYYHLLPDDMGNDLCDLADRLRYVASASESETLWIANLRTMIRQKEVLYHNELPQSDAQNVQQPPAAHSALPAPTDNQVPVNAAVTTGEDAIRREASPSRRSRSESLAEEARDWHAQLQDPLQMSLASPRTSVGSTDTRDGTEGASRQLIQSNATQHGYGVGAHVVQAATESYHSSTIPPHLGAGAPRQPSVDEPSSNSEDTSARSTIENTPVRTLSHQSENLPMAQQPSFQNFRNNSSSQVAVSQSSSHAAPQLHVHSGQQNVSSAQSNGLSDPNLKKNGGTQASKGFFGHVKEKLLKAIPSGNEMILPDDSQPTIVWDPVKGRYVGAGVEEETASAPPPKIDTSVPQANSGGLRAARSSGGSRYFNPLNQISSTNDTTLPQPSAPVPVMQMPTKFGFIPTMPDNDSGESVDPFSGQANPTIRSVDAISSAQ